MLDVEDAQARAELHLKLCERYMREAEDLLAKGDYARASERAWGASSQMVKALAAGGEELRGHAGLWEYVDRLAEELGDIELRRLWRALAVLHRNFYGDWMPPGEVELSVRGVETLLEKLRAAAKL
jgi:uncharacterized protein (UPF0332 family)